MECRSETRSGRSCPPSRVIHEKPKESLVSLYLSLSASSSSLICSRSPAKPPPSAGFTHTDPTPVGLSPMPASSVIAADGSAKSSSRSGFTGLLRPRIVSRRPMKSVRRSGDRLAELGGDLRQLVQPLLQRRGCGEPRGDAEPVGQRGREEERVEGLGRTQVASGDPGHVARDLLQGRGQCGRTTG